LVEAIMSELEPLDPLSAELLEAARGEHVPPAGSRERVQRRIVSRVGAAAFASATIASAGLWIKLGASVLAVALLGGAIYFAMHRAPVVGVPAIVRVNAPEPPLSVAPSPLTVDSAEPVEPVASVSAPRPPKSHPTARASSASPTSISEETALLLGAESAIREGDAARALAQLDEHARRFPSGALVEEREATRVLALCAAGRAAEARAASERFLAAHPRSPAAARVRTSCVSP
jgi:hypothetical protein